MLCGFGIRWRLWGDLCNVDEREVEDACIQLDHHFPPKGKVSIANIYSPLRIASQLKGRRKGWAWYSEEAGIFESRRLVRFCR